MCPNYNPPEDSGKSYKKNQSELKNQDSDNRGTGAPTDHVCPLNRNCRAKCLAWQGSGKPGESKNELPAALRWFRRNHKWHESRPLGNPVKLRLVFKKPIRSAVNKLLADRLDGLTAKIEGGFSKLQEKAEALDNLCVNRINDEDELVMLEHTMAYLDEGLVELAELVEIGQKTESSSVPAEPRETKSQNRKTRKTTNPKRIAETTFNHWNEEKAACFTYQSGRVYFCCNKESKKIPFREDSQAPLVLGAFLDGPVSGEKIKGLTKATSGASQIVRNVNRTINTRLRRIGFTDIQGMQFIYFDNGANAYRLKPDILEHTLYLSQRENKFE